MRKASLPSEKRRTKNKTVRPMRAGAANTQARTTSLCIDSQGRWVGRRFGKTAKRVREPALSGGRSALNIVKYSAAKRTDYKTKRRNERWGGTILFCSGMGILVGGINHGVSLTVCAPFGTEPRLQLLGGREGIANTVIRGLEDWSISINLFLRRQSWWHYFQAMPTTLSGRWETA